MYGLLVVFPDIFLHAANAVCERHTLQSFFHTFFHIPKHIPKNRSDIMPDNAGIIRILMEIKQMQLICLHDSLVDVKKRNILRLPDKPETANTPASLDDSGFT